MCKVSHVIRKLALCKQEKQIRSVSAKAGQRLYFSLPRCMWYLVSCLPVQPGTFVAGLHSREITGTSF